MKKDVVEVGRSLEISDVQRCCAVLKCSELYILLVDLFMLSVSTNEITTSGTTNRNYKREFLFSEDDSCYGEA